MLVDVTIVTDVVSHSVDTDVVVEQVVSVEVTSVLVVVSHVVSV